MSPIAAPFVIIMNADLASSHTQWRVVHRDPTLADARLHGQYADVIASYPRDRYQATIVEVKTLIHTPSGIVKQGAIYKLSEIVARVRAKKMAVPAGLVRRRAKLPLRTVKAPSISLGKKSVGMDDRYMAPIMIPIIIKKKGELDIKRTYAPIITKKGPKFPKKGR
jgi:hypothetical protein